MSQNNIQILNFKKKKTNVRFEYKKRTVLQSCCVVEKDCFHFILCLFCEYNEWQSDLFHEWHKHDMKWEQVKYQI